MKDDVNHDSIVARYGAFFLKKRRITLLAILIVLVGGLYSMANLVREGFPQINVPIGIVSTVYPGASSVEIERQVTDPLEAEIAEIDGIKTLSSSSGQNLSSISVELESSADEEETFRQLREAVQRAQSELPEGAEDPTVSELETGAGFNIRVGVSGEGLSYEELLANAQTLQEEVKLIPGVARVNVIGEREQLITVDLDAVALRDRGLSVEQISQIVQASNADIPGGTVENNQGGRIAVRTLGAYQDVQQLRDTQVAPGTTLDDVAEITETREEDLGILRLGVRDEAGDATAAEALFVDIEKDSTSNITDIHDDVVALLPELSGDGTLAEGVETAIVLSDADDVRQQLEQLITNGWQGLLIIFIVLMIFINRRGSVAVVFIIPFVLLITLLVLFLSGQTLNVMILFSLILTMGMIVDNAIVIVEAIQHHLDKGKKRMHAAKDALAETGPAVLAATVTTLLVFIPMMFLPGITGEFIKLIPITVGAAIVGSLFIALSITPFIATLLLRERRSRKTGEIKEEWKLVKGYGRMMDRLLKSKLRFLVVLLAFVLFVGSMSLPGTGALGTEQWPAVDTEFMFVNVSIDKDQPRQDIVDAVLHTEAIVNDIPEVEIYSFTTGSFGFLGSGSGAVPTSVLGIIQLSDTSDRERTSIEIGEAIDDAVDFDRAEISASAGDVGPPQASFEIQYQLSGNDIEKLQELSVAAAEEFRGIETVKEVEDGVNGQTVEELRITLRRDDLQDAGLTSAQVGATVRAILTGSDAGSVQVAGEETTRDVVLSVPGTENIEDLKALPIATPLGTTVRLDSIADVSEGASLATIEHFDQKRYVEGSISVAEQEDGTKDVAAVQAKVEEFFSEEKLAEYDLDERAVSYRGQFEEDNESFASIGVVFLIAILLMYLILAAQFNSLGQPFLILITVPLALILVFPTLAVFNANLSFLASIGVVALAGVVVNDAIVYLSYVNTLRRRGMKIHEALVEGGKVRLKPILSTTITTAGGILPLTLTVPFWKDMGLTLMSGLIMATIGTLIVVPVIFKTSSNVTERVMKRIRGRKKRAK